MSQYGLLEGLANRRAARVQELARDAGIAPSTATRILDALERREIVVRNQGAGCAFTVRMPLGRDGSDGVAAGDYEGRANSAGGRVQPAGAQRR